MTVQSPEPATDAGPLAGANGIVVLDARREGPELRLALSVPAGCGWFAGHFPGEPILPGVVQLMLAIAAARRLGASWAQPSGIHQLKFKAPIRPDAVVELRVAPGPSPGAITFSYASAAGEHSSGRLQYGEAANGRS